MRNKNTKETTQEKLDNLHGKGTYKIIGDYESTSTPVLVEHSCGYQWKPTPSNLYQKEFCPGCKLTGVSKKPLTIEERELAKEQVETEQEVAEGYEYFYEGFVPKSFNGSYPVPVRVQPNEMGVLKEQKRKYENFPILF